MVSGKQWRKLHRDYNRDHEYGCRSHYTPTRPISEEAEGGVYRNRRFQSQQDSGATSIKKNVAKDPVINIFMQGDDTADSHLCIEIELDTIENVWYMIKIVIRKCRRYRQGQVKMS